MGSISTLSPNYAVQYFARLDLLAPSADSATSQFLKHKEERVIISTVRKEEVVKNKVGDL